MLKLKVGDKVRVLSGKDKGREGTIELIFPKKKKALVTGINIYKKHVKKNVARDGKGGIYEVARPVSLSKLTLLDPKTNRPTRVGFRIQGGKKLRIAKKSQSILDLKGAKK